MTFFLEISLFRSIILLDETLIFHIASGDSFAVLSESEGSVMSDSVIRSVQDGFFAHMLGT